MYSSDIIVLITCAFKLLIIYRTYFATSFLIGRPDEREYSTAYTPSHITTLQVYV